MTRKELIKRSLDNVINEWKNTDKSKSPYYLIDDVFKNFNFLANYKDMQESDCDILTIAYITENNVIKFMTYIF